MTAFAPAALRPWALLLSLWAVLGTLATAHAQSVEAGTEPAGATDAAEAADPEAAASPSSPRLAPSAPAPPSGPMHELLRLEGRKILQLAVECDDPSLCRDAQKGTLLSLVRIQPGDALQRDRVSQAWSRLLRTEAFSRVEVRVAEAPDGVVLRFIGTVAVTVTQVTVVYADAASSFYPKQFETQIKKRLSLRKGGNYPVDDPEVIRRQEANVLELYERQGYRNTEVQIVPHFHGRGGKFVRVEVRIHEGDQAPIGRVLVQGNEAHTYTETMAAVDTGERVDFWPDVFQFLGIGTYERRKLRDQLKAVEQQFRDEGFFAARVRLDDVLEKNHKVYPLVRVEEGPKVDLVFEGASAISREALRQATTFVASGAIDETEIVQSQQAIQQLYQAAGLYFAQVAARREHEIKDETGRHVRIVFHIDEGPRVYVRSIRFHGNSHISTGRLSRAMETRGVGAGGVVSVGNASDAVLQDARLTNDLTAVRDLYRQRGFAGLKFRCMPEDQVPDVWEALRRLPPEEDTHNRLRGRFDVWSEDPTRGRCFRVARDPDARFVNVEVELDEGLRTTLDQVDLSTVLAEMHNEPEWKDELYDLLQRLGFVDKYRRPRLHGGLNRQDVVSLEGFLLRNLRSKGFNAARVEAHCADSAAEAALPIAHAPPDPGAPDKTCAEASLFGRTIHTMSFRVARGPASRVAGVLIHGNLETHEDTIRKELLFQVGGPLSTDDLFLSQSNLRSLGIFDAVRIETIGQDEAGMAGDQPGTELTPQQAIVRVDVEESSAIQIDASAGLRLDSTPLNTQNFPLLFAFATTVRDKNLFGRALEGGITGEHDNRVSAPTDFYGDESRWVLGPFLTDRRFLSTRLVGDLALRGQGGLTDQRNQYEQRAEVTTGLTYDFFNLSYPNTWGRGLSGTFKTTYGRKQLRELTRRGRIPPFADPVNELKFQPQLSWDRRDNPLHPTRGFLLTLQSEARFLSNAIVPSLLEPALKETLTSQYIRSFFERQLILVPTLRLGAVQSPAIGTDQLRDFLFLAGGDAVSNPVRGYADAAIDACNGNFRKSGCGAAVDPTDDRILRSVGGRAYVGGSFETRFPTFLVDDFWLAGFADFAAIAPTWGEMDRSRVHPSVGAGLRWLITGQIPLRLDVGFPLRATVFSKADPRIHLNIFYQL